MKNRPLKTIIFKIELFVGTDIKSASDDLCELSNRIGVLCEADFNGVKLWARPGDNPAILVEAYHEQLRLPEGRYKIAQCR